MRLFIGIPMPEVVKEQLVELQKPIDGFRWQEKQKLHLTLKFLGETEQPRAQKVDRELAGIDLSGFSITLNGLGYFPENKQPRVLWAGIKKTKPLQKLYEAVEKRCIALGFNPEQRDFKPHVTIARIKNSTRSEVESFIDQYNQLHLPDVPVKEFVLFESKLKPEGAKHSRINTYYLSQQ